MLESGRASLAGEMLLSSYGHISHTAAQPGRKCCPCVPALQIHGRSSGIHLLDRLGGGYGVSVEVHRIPPQGSAQPWRVLQGGPCGVLLSMWVQRSASPFSSG